MTIQKKCCITKIVIAMNAIIEMCGHLNKVMFSVNACKKYCKCIAHKNSFTMIEFLEHCLLFMLAKCSY